MAGVMTPTQIATALIVIGYVLVVAGVSFIYWPAGIVTAGALALLIGFFGVDV